MIAIPWSSIGRLFRSVICIIWNGEHELYPARTKWRVYQRCLLCGYETKGWNLERK